LAAAIIPASSTGMIPSDILLDRPSLATGRN